MGARLISSRRVHSGRVVSLDLDDVEEPGGIRVVREVVRHPGSVAILPVHDDGSITLVRQYRRPADAEIWELPAGRLEPGEEPLRAAARELEEEAGLSAGALAPLGPAFYTTPGFCDERLQLVRGLPVIDAALLENGSTYEISIRGVLDMGTAPAVFGWLRFWADDWNAASDWYSWTLPR